MKWGLRAPLHFVKITLAFSGKKCYLVVDKNKEPT